jgi:hypothetical protein
MVKEIKFDFPFFFLFIPYFQKLYSFQHEAVSSLQQASWATYFNQVPFWPPMVGKLQSKTDEPQSSFFSSYP